MNAHHLESALEARVSFQDRVFSEETPRAQSIRGLAEAIRQGRYQDKIEQIQSAIGSNDSRAAKRLKKQLPAALFAGLFKTSTNAGLESHSGLLVVDFDGIAPDQIQRFKADLGQHPATVLVFISPSGRGLKWVVSVNATDAASHRACFDACCRVVAERFSGLLDKIDPRCKEVSRRCFMSFDPEIIVRVPAERISPIPGSGTECEIDWQNGRMVELQTGRSGKTGSSTAPPAPPMDSNVHKLAASDPSLRQRVQKLVPGGPHQNHDHLFLLSRLCRDLEIEHGLCPLQLPMEDRKIVFNLWLELTPKELRRHSDGDYWDEFTQKFHDAKLPLSCAPWRVAWERSRTEPPPEWWLTVIKFREPKRIRMLTMLHIQATLTGGLVIAPIDKIVEAAKAEGIAELDHSEKVSRVLKGFRPVLELVQKASKALRKAAVYRLQVPSTGNQTAISVPGEGIVSAEASFPARPSALNCVVIPQAEEIAVYSRLESATEISVVEGDPEEELIL